MPRELGNTTYYDPTEVSIVLGRHYDTALRRIKNGEIPSEKVNGGYLVSHSDLVKYLDEVEALPESIIDLKLHKKPINQRSN